MPEFVLKYADAQGALHERVEEADTAHALRERYVEEGLLVYAVKPRRKLGELRALGKGRPSRLNLEHFRKQAKQLLRDVRGGDDAALQRTRLARGHRQS